MKSIFFQILKIVHAVLIFAELYCVTKDLIFHWLITTKFYFTLAACYLKVGSGSALAPMYLLRFLTSRLRINSYLGHSVLITGGKRKEIWQKYVLALKSAWMFAYMPLEKAKVQWGRVFTL